VWDVHDSTIDRPLLREAAEDGADAWLDVETLCYHVTVPSLRDRPFLVAQETVDALEDILGPEDGWQCLKATLRHMGTANRTPTIDLDAWNNTGATA